MNIPKTFQLYGNTWEVIVDRDYCDQNQCLGRCCYTEHKIYLNPSSWGQPVARSELERVWGHELVHALLLSMNERDLSANEKFVDILASLIHQALSTASGNACEASPVKRGRGKRKGK